MSLPDGEYDIDISAITGAKNPESLAIRYGFVPEAMDQSKPLVLYDDGQNLVLEATDTNDETMVFEGFGNKASKNGEAYYLRLDGQKKVTLSELGGTIRVSRSRNLIKWKNLITKWNSELQSEHITPAKSNIAKQTPKTAIRDDPEIISESDFETLDNEFPVFDLDLEDDLEKELVAALDDTVDEKNTLPAIKKSTPTAFSNHRPNSAGVQRASSSSSGTNNHQRVTKTPTGPKQASSANKAGPESKAKPLPASLPVKPTHIASPKPASKNKNSGSVLRSFKPKIASKRPSRPVSRAPTKPATSPNVSSVADDDDFKDLEDQLQEVLEDSSDDSDSFVGGGVTIIDEPPKKQNIYRSASASKPMSLREFMGEKKYDEDVISEEE